MAMLCSCVVVRDRDIVAAIDEGARSVDEVTDICGAGGMCGGCRPTIEAMLERAQAVCAA